MKQRPKTRKPGRKSTSGGPYELVVGEVLTSLASQCGFRREDVSGGRRNRQPGASGYTHQIDVSAKGQNDLVLVECKYWGKPVSVEAVLVLSARIADIRPTLPPETTIEVAKVHSAQEFVLRYKDRWNLGFADRMEQSDDVKIELGTASPTDRDTRGAL